MGPPALVATLSHVMLMYIRFHAVVFFDSMLMLLYTQTILYTRCLVCIVHLLAERCCILDAIRLSPIVLACLLWCSFSRLADLDHNRARVLAPYGTV